VRSAPSARELQREKAIPTMSQRLARMQRRAARKSIEGWSKANASQVRDGIIEQMAAVRRVHRWKRALQVVLLLVVCGLAVVLYRWAVR